MKTEIIHKTGWFIQVHMLDGECVVEDDDGEVNRFRHGIEWATIEVNPDPEEEEEMFFQGLTIFLDRKLAKSWAGKLRYRVKKNRFRNTIFGFIDKIDIRRCSVLERR